MPRLIYRGNPLAYPGRNPGFDPAHPASAGIVRLSAVAANGTFVNILSGAAGTNTGTASKIDGAVGPAILYSANTDVTKFAIGTSFTDANGTMAAMFRYVSDSGARKHILTECDSGGTAPDILLTAASNFALSGGGGSFATPQPGPLSVGHSYFVVASWSGTAIANMLVGDIGNGKVLTATGANGTLGGSGSNFNIGNLSGQNQFLGGQVAAVMACNTFLSMPKLLAWAADPWSFWYPTRVQDLIFSGLSKPSGSTLLRKTLSPLGTRLGSRQPQWAA